MEQETIQVKTAVLPTYISILDRLKAEAEAELKQSRKNN